MYLHLTSDTETHEPNIGLDFRANGFGLDARIGFTDTECEDPECAAEHPETVVLSLRHVAHDDLSTPHETRDAYVPTVRILLTPEDAAAAVAVWTRMIAEQRPDLLAVAMDKAMEAPTLNYRGQD